MVEVVRASEAQFPGAIRKSARVVTLALLTLTCFSNSVDRQVLSILVEPIRADFHLSDSQLGLLGGFAFALFYGTLGIPVASLSDRLNRRNIVVIALTVWSFFTALCGFANSFAQLLLYRVGVGVGEGGAGPPSQSMIADLYPPEKRAGALALYSLGINIGAAFGVIIGGMVAHYYGWRWAFVAVGAPGVLLAVLVRLFAVEPVRGASERRDATPEVGAPGIWQGCKAIWANKSAVHLIAGFTLTSTIGNGLTYWGAAFYQRSFGFSLLQVSTIIAPVLAVAGVCGAVGGGIAANYCARRWGLWSQATMIAILKLLALPFAAILYAGTNASVGVSAYFVSILFASCYIGPSLALIQALAPLKMRSLWAAITALLTNLIGLGIGPLAIGSLSDALRPHFGQDSLRWALLAGLAVTPWAIYHYWRAGVYLKQRGASTGLPIQVR